MSLLKLENIHTYYDLSHILFGVSLELAEKEVVFLLGRNGVGKTTTLRSIMGIPSPKEGSITFKNQQICGIPAHKIAQLGISLVPEDRRILPGLTVEENLLIACMAIKRTQGKWSAKRVYELFPILGSRKGQEGVTLSGGEQQMLAIGRGLMSNPAVLLIDEPVEGLAPLVAKSVGDILIELKNQGSTMLVIDDDMKLASRAADRIYFMDQGCVKWSGSCEEVMEDDFEMAKRFLSAR